MNWLGRYIAVLGKQYELEIERRVFESLPEGKNLVYLDCGCDDGAKTLARAKRMGTENILGIEVESSRASKAAPRGIKIYEVDLNKPWNFSSQSIDVITATEVVEHLTDLDNFFSEAKRVLKKDGWLIISTENLAAWHNILALILGNQPYTGPYLSRIYPIGHRPHAKFYKRTFPQNPHLNVMTTRALQQLLERYHFKIQKIVGVGFYPFPGFLADLLARIDKNHASYVVVNAFKK